MGQSRSWCVDPCGCLIEHPHMEGVVFPYKAISNSLVRFPCRLSSSFLYLLGIEQRYHIAYNTANRKNVDYRVVSKTPQNYIDS